MSALALLAAATLLAAGDATTAPVSGAPAARVERRLAAMGTDLRLAVEAADRERALAASEAAVRAIETAEARLSTWRDDSELARLDAAPVGTPVAVSPALARELATARACALATGGAFDPTVGALVAAWGLRSGGRRPGDAELAAARERTGVDGLALDGASATRKRDVVVEEGAWGKGAGLDDAAAALAAAGAAGVVDLGGQLRTVGAGSWHATLADPADRGRAVLALDLGAGSLATSGNSEHGIVVDGERLGHLLDPRSGRPAADVGSVTVWVADAADAGLRADCLSTGLYVLGPDRALAFAAAHPGVEVVALARVDGRLRARASAGLAGRLRAVASAGAEPVEVLLEGSAGVAEVPSGTAASGIKEGRVGRHPGRSTPDLPGSSRGARASHEPRGE